MGTRDCYNFILVLGGGKRDRTADLLHAMQALSQLSYTPQGNNILPYCIYFYQRVPLVARCQNPGVPTGIRTPVLTVKG